MKKKADSIPTKAAGVPAQTLPMVMLPGETEEQTRARCSVEPMGRAALSAFSFPWPGVNGGPSLEEMAYGIARSVKQSKAGDLSAADEMLVSEAYALDALFHALLSRGAANIGTHIDAAEKYLRLALKAQSQARATWESLSKIKNPLGATFVRQANIANGPQQVNNGDGSQPAQAREIES